MKTAVLTLDIGGTKIASSIVCDSETIIPLPARPTQAARGGDAVLSTVKTIIHTGLEQAHTKQLKITQIGVASAGVIDPITGAVTYASNLMPNWAGTPLKETLEHTFDLPVTVLNDVHAHALGEARNGAGQRYRRILVVAAGTGLGGAYIQNGRVEQGNAGIAGSIAHLLHPLAAKIPCACGSASGHIETIVSGTGQATLYNQYRPDHLPPATSGGEVYQRALDGEQHALQTLANSGRALGETLASACALLDPEAIILTGSATRSGEGWWEGVRSGFQSDALPLQHALPILAGTLGGNAPLIGAYYATQSAQSTS